MRFWDSSALAPLVIAEQTSREMTGLLRADGDIATWWATRVEVASAVARQAREGLLGPSQHAAALGRLGLLAAGWSEVSPTEQLRDTAARLLRTHPLRAADALQLAAAVVAAEHRPEALPFVTLDQRLADAAGVEGFQVIVS